MNLLYYLINKSAVDRFSRGAHSIFYIMHMSVMQCCVLVMYHFRYKNRPDQELHPSY